MRDSDSRSSISRAMRRACSLHDAEEAVARRGIVARRALQRLDEAEQRRQRRAQLVAGIGDEVGAHPLDAPQRRQIVEGQSRRSRRPPGGDDRRDKPRTSGRSARARRTRRAAARRLFPARRIESTSSGIRSAISAGSPRRSAGAMRHGFSLNAMTLPSRSSTIAASAGHSISGSISRPAVRRAARRRRGAAAPASASERPTRQSLPRAAQPAPTAWGRPARSSSTPCSIGVGSFGLQSRYGSARSPTYRGPADPAQLAD